MRSYLYLNAGLYLLFAAWCTLAPTSTRINLGYEAISNSGKSEYLVIYGGLQLGLAIVFLMMARTATYNRLGVDLAIALYLPVVFYRLITVSKFWPVETLTIATGGLECLLLVAALWLRFRS